MVLIEKNLHNEVNKKRYIYITLSIICIISVIVLLMFNLYVKKYSKFSDKDIEKFYNDKKYNGMMVRYNPSKDKTIFSKVFQKSFRASYKTKFFALLGKYPVDTININVDFMSFEKIKKRRLDAMSGYLFAADDDNVPVSIQYKGKTVKAKMRLKGDQGDHRDDPKKWSFKFNVKKDKTLFGMRSFSIQHPKVRGFQYEPVISDAFRMFDVLCPRYFFVNVTINGDPIGIMAFEESFSKELLEHNRRKEGVIFKFYENDLWRAIEKFGWLGPDQTVPTAMYLNGLNVPILVFNEKAVRKSEVLSNQERVGVGMLRGVMEGYIKPSEVFDIERTAAYLALLTFFETNHPIMSINLRFYLDPLSFKLEPIAYDYNGEMPISLESASISRNLELTALMLQDKIIYDEYKKAMIKIERLINDNSFIETLKNKEDGYLTTLHQEFTALPDINFEDYLQKQKRNFPRIITDKFFIDKSLRKKTFAGTSKYKSDVKLPAVVNAYIIKDNDKIYMEFANILSEETVINNLVINVDGVDKKTSDLCESGFPITLPPTYTIEKPNYARVYLKNIPQSSKLVVKGTARPKSQNIIYDFSALDYFPALKKNPIAPDALKKILAENRFIVPEDSQTLRIKKGEWIVKQMLILPQNMDLVIDSGTMLKFMPQAGLIIRGTINCDGSSQKPVIFEGIDGSWKGITALNANFYSSKKESVLNNVIIRNTTFAEYGLWKITGGVTFYKSNVRLKNVTFDTSSAEDGINVANSAFFFDGVKIHNTRSDAFDSDFSSGTILNCSFENSGGDGIDFSGSVIEVKDTVFKSISDKAVSVGEMSLLSVDNIFVDKAGTGAASKDGSVLYIQNSKFLNIEHSVLMAYMKKPEYGGAKIVAGNITYDDAKDALIAQKKSILIIDNKKIMSRKVDIDKLYKEGYMKK
ncbi:MAG: right-handed parallel beta-helix repeat-containing protein [Elusimicrobiota bacterium]